jgi:hypothetical protein
LAGGRNLRSGGLPPAVAALKGRPHDHRSPRFYLDANCVNAGQLHAVLNELESLRKLGHVTLIYADVTYREAACASTARMAKASGYSHTKIDPVWGENENTKEAIEAILFPGGANNQNQRNDVLAVYQAERLHWPLITMDGASKSQPGGILGRTGELAAIGLEVLTPEQALERVRVYLSDTA